GRSRISNDTCNQLGLPMKLAITAFSEHAQYSWSSETYKDIHRWQLDRGFNPTTTDFALNLGYPIYKVI
ncbi:hypothetical protein L218DRAFT_843054, partial [Marasmius fiardii PR-910]